MNDKYMRTLKNLPNNFAFLSKEELENTNIHNNIIKFRWVITVKRDTYGYKKGDIVIAKEFNRKEIIYYPEFENIVKRFKLKKFNPK